MASFLLNPSAEKAEAFSFVESILKDKKASAQSIQFDNSQTIGLLRAPLNPNPDVFAVGGGDITIVGDVALLSESGPEGTLADIEHVQPESNKISVYVVRNGDTISQIARMFNVSTNTIVWSNDITKGSFITPGQTLVILPISGVQHKVVRGDTVATIAKKYAGNVKEILKYNSLEEGASLSVGDTITVPDGEIEAPKYVATTQASLARGTSGPEYSGYYMRPISGGQKSQGLHGYNGVDLATYTGAPIFAAASGRVIISKSSGWNGGYGLYVVVEHQNGTQTLYAHASQTIVSVGQQVVQGQVIAYVGNTGKSTGSHIHFEIRGARNPF